MDGGKRWEEEQYIQKSSIYVQIRNVPYLYRDLQGNWGKKEFEIFQILLLTYSSEQKAIECNLLIILNKLCLVHSTDEDEQNFNINL